MPKQIPLAKAKGKRKREKKSCAYVMRGNGDVVGKDGVSV
jgi:hypothetical protein